MNSLNRFADPFYCIMRLVVGLMFACHGGERYSAFRPGPKAGEGMMLIGAWIELVGGFMIALGLLTRVAAFISSGEMAVAFFMMHAPKRLDSAVTSNKGEAGRGLLFRFLLHLPARFRRWSIDAMMGKGKAASTAP